MIFAVARESQIDRCDEVETFEATWSAAVAAPKFYGRRCLGLIGPFRMPSTALSVAFSLNLAGARLGGSFRRALNLGELQGAPVSGGVPRGF